MFSLLRRTSLVPLLRAYSTPAASAAPPALDSLLRTSLKTFMKARDSFRTTVIKVCSFSPQASARSSRPQSLLSDLAYAAHNPSPPSPSKSLAKAIAARQDAAATFLSSSPPRADLAEQYEREVVILREFVSEDAAKGGMGKEELERVVRGVLEEMKAVLVEGKGAGKEVGQVIKKVVEKVAGAAGGKEIAEAVRSFGAAAK